MTVGSLFSGIGGFDLGLERAGMRVEWQVENNDYCRRVLGKHWSGVPRYGDIKTIDWHTVEAVDLVCGGFPCQPFSLAGKRRGQDDDRYLWPEVVRCLDTLRPTWFLGENVPGLINLALDQVCTDLEALGYTVWPVCVPACAVDAWHQRQRIWIVAHASGNSDRRTNRVRGRERKPEQSLSHVWGNRREEVMLWEPEPGVGRVVHGLPNQTHRIRGLGNAVVPQIAEEIGRMILSVECAGGPSLSGILPD